MLINSNLEKEFNLAPIDSFDEDEEVNEEQEEVALTVVDGPVSIDHYEKIDNIEKALPVVEGLDAADKEFDELAEYGLQAHKDLMDLAMNIEQRFAGEVASAAGSMLAHAITAKTNKIKKKLDMVNLQLKKQLADHKTKTEKPADGDVIPGEGMVLDRNDLLKHLLAKPEKPQ